MTAYYMLTGAGSVTPGSTLAGTDDDGDARFITADPRKLHPYDQLDEREFPAVLTGHVLLRLSPRGPVTPAAYQTEDGETACDERYSGCPDGWTAEAAEPLGGLLGPQAAQILAAITEAERVLIGDPEGMTALAYNAAADAAYEAGNPVADESAAAGALDRYGADGSWWEQCHSCAYGAEITALAARDLIGTTPGWTREAYDRLTRPWRAAFGPVHPDDTAAAKEVTS